MKRYIKCATYNRNFESKDKWFPSISDGDTIVYDPYDMPESIFKMNGLGNVVDKIAYELSKGDMIIITQNSYTSYILITDEYSNGNRGYTVVFPSYDSEDKIRSYLDNGATRSWRDITDGSAWLDISRKPYTLTVKKNAY